MRLLNVPFSFFRSALSRSPCQYFRFVSFPQPFLAVLFGIGSLFYYPPSIVLQFWLSLLVFFYLVGLFFFSRFGSFPFAVSGFGVLRLSGVRLGVLRLRYGVCSLLSAAIISDSVACPFGRQFFPILYGEWAGSL